MFDIQFNSDIANTNNNNLHNGLSQILLNFNKINIKEIEPTTENINKYISEDLDDVIDDLINLISKKLNEGEYEEPIKEHVLDYINNQEITLQEINCYLLNNQNISNNVYLLGCFSYYGIGSKSNKQKGIELCQKAIELKDSMVQLNITNIYKYDTNYHYPTFELSKKLAEEEYDYLDDDDFIVCY
ncbi:unnamed protein product [Rhizophagus irregularis]|nr:unnamed protein product [Rhizophagus irregularis]